MATLFKFETEAAATEYIGIVAEYIEYDLTKDGMPMEAVVWMVDNINSRVACFFEEAFDKNFFILLFQHSEDAVAFKLRFL